MMYPQIIDANINRIAEGLRVIEEYTRFVVQHKTLTDQLSEIRKRVNQSEPHPIQNLLIRNITKDTRALETPQKRKNITDLLKANFKRAEEGLRVMEEYTQNPLYNELRYQLYTLEKEILLHHLKPKIKPGIYLISDEIAILEQGLKTGVSLIQLRSKGGSKPELLQKATILKELSKHYKTPFIINDHLDIALLVDADGFHSGQDDISVACQRELLGPHKIIGKTTHTFAQGKKAKTEGADYVSVGPIWETPSKPNRQAIGFDYLKKAHNLGIPFVAIGGINVSNYLEIAPYAPLLVGIIRAHHELKKLNRLFKQNQKR